MGKIILIVALLASSISFAQVSYSVKTVEILDRDCPMRLRTNVTIIYFPTGFTIISEDKRLYSYLVPGIEFFSVDNLTFYDTGKTLNDTLLFPKGSPAVIYQSTLKTKVEIAQHVDSNSVTIMKRNLTGIKFIIK